MALDLLNSNNVRVAAYVLGAMLATGAATSLARSPAKNRRLVASWAVLALLMAVLGLARIIDVGPWLTALGRERAQIEGWYDERREIQFWSVWAVVGATAGAALLLLLTLPRQTRPALPASLVASALLGFVLVRAISFHNVDAALYRYDYHGLLLNTACELGLVAAFAASVGIGALLTNSRIAGRRP